VLGNIVWVGWLLRDTPRKTTTRKSSDPTDRHCSDSVTYMTFSTRPYLRGDMKTISHSQNKDTGAESDAMFMGLSTSRARKPIQRYCWLKQKQKRMVDGAIQLMKMSKPESSIRKIALCVEKEHSIRVSKTRIASLLSPKMVKVIKGSKSRARLSADPKLHKAIQALIVTHGDSCRGAFLHRAYCSQYVVEGYPEVSCKVFRRALNEVIVKLRKPKGFTYSAKDMRSQYGYSLPQCEWEPNQVWHLDETKLRI